MTNADQSNVDPADPPRPEDGAGEVAPTQKAEQLAADLVIALQNDHQKLRIASAGTTFSKAQFDELRDDFLARIATAYPGI